MSPLAILLLLWPTGETASCAITGVSDGDTFRASCAGMPPRRVRLWGLDTPEIYRTPEPGGHEAREALRGLLTGVLIGYVHQDDDGFGRRVVRLETRDGTDIACAMIAAGHGVDDERWSRGAYAECG